MKIGAVDGDWVTATIFTTSADPDAPVPLDRRVEGVLTLVWSDPLRRWRATVAGQPVDPASVQPATPPGGDGKLDAGR